MVKIVDCIIFYNEIKMLQFRLAELAQIVDYFIICEAPYTFAGNSKPLYYQENKGLFKEYDSQIIHVIVDDMPNNGNAWDNEFHQRRAVSRGLSELEMEDTDLILISDVDEIPAKGTLQQIKSGQNKILERDGVAILQLDVYFYNFTCKGDLPWADLKITTYKYFNNLDSGGRDLQKIRKSYRLKYCYQVIPGEKEGDSKSLYRSKPIVRIPNAGWHLTYFGDIEFIRNKIRNIAHQEFNKPEYLDEKLIQSRIEKCDDLFGRDNKRTHGLKYVPLKENNNLPENYQMLTESLN